jgi:hypothetical protein
MGLAIIAEVANLRIFARNDPSRAPPGCLEKDAVAWKTFDASISLGS